MRDKSPQDRSNQKGKLSSDAKIIIALIKQQPQGKRQLIEKAKISDSGFSRTEPMLLNAGLIKIVEGGYVLWNYEKHTSSLEEKFMELKQSDQYTVSIGILANYVGKPPDSIKAEAYRLGKKYNVMIIEDTI